MAWKEYCAEHWFKEFQKSMDMCTGRCDVAEILLKIVLNTIQSINHCQLLLKVGQKFDHTATPEKIIQI